MKYIIRKKETDVNKEFEFLDDGTEENNVALTSAPINEIIDLYLIITLHRDLTLITSIIHHYKGVAG